jgi:hypothetical protein
MYCGDSTHRLHTIGYATKSKAPRPDPQVLTGFTVPALFVGRIVQAISGAATWIASFAMLVDTVEPERRGQTLALAMSVITCGTVVGPAIAGTVLQLAGYWAAWSVPLVLLGLDAIARLAMVERDASGSPRDDKMEEDCPETPEPQECAGFLHSPAGSYKTMSQQQPQSKTAKTQTTTTTTTIRSSSNSFRDPWSDELTPAIPLPSSSFYRTMLSHPGVLAGLANTLGQSLILAAFDTTLPQFLRSTFSWGSMPVGLIFLGLQGPIIVLGPVVGGMRDRMGCRIPTVVGWGIVAPFLLLLATMGRPEFAWAISGAYGEVLAVVCIAGIGVGFLLIRGSGGFQVIGMVCCDFSGLGTFC